MGKGMPACRLVLAAGALLLACAGPARADLLPPSGTYLTGFGGNTFSLVRDGTSNTIQVSESSRLSVCFEHVAGSAPLSSITDGTSNTIKFGESLFLTLQVGQSLAHQPIGNITDGTSNTIFIGENADDERCFAGDTAIVDIGNAIVDGTSNTIEFGEGSRFDVCFRGARLGSITDGTSNTIQFGEVSQNPVCFEDVQVAAPAASAVPEPGTLAALGFGLFALCGVRLRRVKAAALLAASLGIAAPAEAGLVATIQPIKICSLTCNEPVFDAVELSDFWEQEAGITLHFLAPRLLFRSDFFTLTDSKLSQLLVTNPVNQTLAEDMSFGTPPPPLSLKVYFARAVFNDIWGATVLDYDAAWVTANRFFGSDLERGSDFQTTVMAHEIGHMLGLPHEDDRDNLMHSSGGDSIVLFEHELTDAQAAIARASRFVTEVPAPATLALFMSSLAIFAFRRRLEPTTGFQRRIDHVA